MRVYIIEITEDNTHWYYIDLSRPYVSHPSMYITTFPYKPTIVPDGIHGVSSCAYSNRRPINSNTYLGWWAAPAISSSCLSCPLPTMTRRHVPRNVRDHTAGGRRQIRRVCLVYIYYFFSQLLNALYFNTRRETRITRRRFYASLILL